MDEYVTAMYGIVMSVFGMMMCIKMVVNCVCDLRNTTRASVILLNIVSVTLFVFFALCFLALAVWAVLTHMI